MLVASFFFCFFFFGEISCMTHKELDHDHGVQLLCYVKNWKSHDDGGVNIMQPNASLVNYKVESKDIT